jgi:ABC-2 type transport system ATP-binding protein|tara:strand:+ start:60 stop:971 length:912 start_codon:yes stop_codon:yes gene_type:complete
MTAILVKNLNKYYDNGFKALSNINLEIKKGEIFALLGPNGAGKSTLINIICGINKKKDGEISVFGHDIEKNYKMARSKIGLVPQEIATDSFEKVIDTLKFSRGLFNKKSSIEYLEKVLKSLELFKKRNQQIRTLSGGMKRRVMIAKAMSHEPNILFLDEPTAGVDVELRQSLWKNLYDLKKNGVTIFLTTHYIEEAERLADRVGIIHQGEILMVEKKDKILEKLGDKRVIITINKTSKNLKNILIKYNYQKKKNKLIFSLDLKNNRNSVSDLFKDLIKNSISFNDVEIKKNNLEEIFLKLIDQ